MDRVYPGLPVPSPEGPLPIVPTALARSLPSALAPLARGVRLPLSPPIRRRLRALALAATVVGILVMAALGLAASTLKDLAEAEARASATLLTSYLGKDLEGLSDDQIRAAVADFSRTTGLGIHWFRMAEDGLWTTASSQVSDLPSASHICGQCHQGAETVEGPISWTETVRGRGEVVYTVHLLDPTGTHSLPEGTGQGFILVEQDIPFHGAAFRRLALAWVALGLLALALFSLPTFRSPPEAPRETPLPPSQASLLRTARQATLGEFASVAIQELKDPMNAIALNLQMASRALSKLDPEHSRTATPRVEAASDALDRLNRVVERMRDLGQPRGAPRHPMDLRRALQGALDLLAASDRVQLEGAHQELLVLGQEDALWQLFASLLGCAMEHAGEDGRVHITVQSDTTRHVVTLHCRSGSLPPPDEARMQASHLGCLMAGRIAAEHGGKVEKKVEDEVNLGYVVHLPAAAAGSAP